MLEKKKKKESVEWWLADYHWRGQSPNRNRKNMRPASNMDEIDLHFSLVSIAKSRIRVATDSQIVKMQSFGPFESREYHVIWMWLHNVDINSTVMIGQNWSTPEWRHCHMTLIKQEGEKMFFWSVFSAQKDFFTLFFIFHQTFFYFQFNSAQNKNGCSNHRHSQEEDHHRHLCWFRPRWRPLRLLVVRVCV